MSFNNLRYHKPLYAAIGAWEGWMSGSEPEDLPRPLITHKALEERTKRIGMSIVASYYIVSFVAGRRTAAPKPSHCPLPRVFLLTFFLIFSHNILSAQDTTYRLDEVQVSGQQAPKTLRTAAPTQVVNAEKIEQQGALQLSDAVRQMAGVTLKDYGGIGGIKTVSARGLGSQFSTLTIDGVPVDDAQNGQVDLGRYLLGGTAFVSLTHGGPQGLPTARAFAAGNIIDMATAEPSFFLAERTNLKAAMELGSFGMMSPSVQWDQKWSKRLKTIFWTNWTKSDGDYPFTLYYTASHTDSSSREIRRHSAMQMFTADATAFYTIDSASRLTAKVHYMRGSHQLPGPVQFYRQTDGSERTAEEVSFIQAKWTRERGRWALQVVGKGQRLFDRYEDSASVQTAGGYVLNEYLQHEGYLSASARLNATPWLDFTAAADGSLSHLNTNLAQRNDVTRSNIAAVLATRIHGKQAEFNAHLLATSVIDRVADLDTNPSFSRIAPYAAFMYTIGNTTIRAFYKENFRAPNFSELYFFSMPRDLRPEHARQIGAGITHASEHLSATVDAYFNNVSDKIVAVPTQSMFLWSMQNVGKVEILGLDATITMHLSSLSAQFTYTYQRALDRTNPDDPFDKTYGHQIAYTPRHSGGGSFRWENRWVNLGLQAMVVGKRYSRMQNNERTRMPAYCDLGLIADRKFDLRWGTMTARVQVLNLLDVQYEVVRSYPMMGRNYRLKIIYEF